MVGKSIPDTIVFLVGKELQGGGVLTLQEEETLVKAVTIGGLGPTGEALEPVFYRKKKEWDLRKRKKRWGTAKK